MPIKRYILTAAALLAGAMAANTLTAGTAEAGFWRPTWEYSVPWCMRSDSGYDDCAYYTFAQCRATVSGAGGTCVHNPHYSPLAEERRPQRKGRRKHAR